MTTPVFLPGKFHGQEPGGLQSMGSDTAEQLSLHFSWKEEDSWMWSGWENTGCNIKAVEFALWL